MSPVAIVGAACRLPGAVDEGAFWRLLDEGRCSVGTLPEGRWRPERYLHPRVAEPGFSYSFAGGYIDDPLGFDPIVFGISPREAAEMDPQQRLLLEVVWGALENSGLPPSALAGKNVGVYVGASSLDYGNLHTTDPAAIESHFMTGNTLSILSNRISYIFDLRGPSFTIDTACSSSLVAFAEAQTAISSGRIDMAIVAGVNLLMSPMSFIGFSRASMLSPTGLCRPFSADADGYVRAEGAVAMVLAKLDTALARHYPVRAVALASGINSDGKTNGISLPSAEGQRELLDRLYGQGAIDTRRLAFVEAHGTGTRVGDPAEATAIGEALGRGRDTPLPIGSVKSNIGHLEPASGLAGLLKAILALEHRKLPASLHLDAINPGIDFAALNLSVATEAVTLPQTGTWLAGISSFGFGGTNAHVVIRQPEAAESSFARASGAAGRSPELLVLSAHSRPALSETAATYAAILAAGGDPAPLAAATAWQRDLAGHRLALPLADPAEMAASLRNFAETGNLAGGVVGLAPSGTPKICFVFSGNGCQWAGMGRVAFAQSEAFRRHFRAIDEIFRRLGDWSLVEALHDEGLAERLKKTRIAQPLLFAVQSALTASLAEWGLKPDMVLGHSVGEVAAAEAAGALSLADAVHVIFHRSEQQETVHGLGGMAAANLPRLEALELIAGSGLDGLEIAAINSPTSVTISGPETAIREFSRTARKRRIAVRVLDIAYPFHSTLLEPLHLPLLASLGGFSAGAGSVPFISTVTGDVLDGHALDREYWWRNVREPVRFHEAVEAAGRQGATLFVEIGPRPILTGNMTDTLGEAGLDGSVIASLVEKDDKGDPLAMIAARALVQGCRLDIERLFGPRPNGTVSLPAYAWQRKVFQQPQTSEALDLYGTAPRHPLIGARLAAGTPEWRNLIDATVVPYLADHRIDDEIVVPGTAFAEMALAVAREIHPDGPIGLEDFDLLQWLPLQPDAMRELSVRLHGDTQIVEIWSRPRLGADEWTLHARGRITQIASPAPVPVPKQHLPHHITADQVYAGARAAGVNYGPAFRRVTHAERSDTVIEIELSPFEEAAGSASRKQILHPVSLDSAFHAMFENIKQRVDERYAYLPVRFAALRVDRDHAVPARARLVVDRETDQSLSISVELYGQDGAFVAGMTGGLFRAVVLDRNIRTNPFFQQKLVRLVRRAGDDDPRAIAAAAIQSASLGTAPDSWLFLGAFARSLSYRCLRSMFGDAPIQADQTIDEAFLPLAFALLENLRGAGLASDTPEGWVLAAETELPAPGEILQTFAADYSDATPEIVLAAQALSGLEPALRSGQPIQVRTAIQEQFEQGSILFAPVLASALAVCDALQGRLAPEPLRVLVAEPFCPGILQSLAPLLREARVAVTVIGVDAKRLHHTAARHGATDGVTFIEIDGEADDAAEAVFDVALGFAYGPVFDGDPSLGRAIARRLAPDGVLCVLQPPDNAVFDLLLGTAEGWFANSLNPQFPVGRLAAAQESSRLLVASGFGAIDTCSLGGGVGSVLVARPDVREAARPAAPTPMLLIEDESPLLAQLAHTARVEGRSVRMLAMDQPGDFAPAWRDACATLSPNDTVDLVFPGFTAADGGLDRSIAHLAAILNEVQTGKCRLWILVRGLDSASADAIDPIAEAVWCFARVAMNEYPSVELKLVDVALDMDAAAAAAQLAGLIAAPGADAELLINGSGVSAIRTIPGLPDAGTAVPAARLSLRARGLQAKFDWIEAERRAPGPTEVEIEIAAAGLNFRDVMLATGLLDDDVLDDGLAGAVFGFECAGRVLRVGSDVTHLAAGDAVMGFGRESFATHSTADARVFTAVPDGLSVEAAATIPVAFLTAWYSLVHLAQIQPGEWVLIHGAAGGVGLAAIQIAKLRGARVAATVSSPDKRALVELFGAEKVYNSRSTAFLDAIRLEIGGVDIVLNSLAGEAMQASIKCLKPFGRFVEMGKRDYVLNTAMGLRPFRRNLTYFGVDLDQLLAANLPLANRLMGDLVRHFESGDFLPLPHRAFDWSDVGKAFQLMQAAGHVGKLIVRPAAQPVATSVTAAPFRPGAGVHLVVGGAGGFGFEAAAWLAERGAETIVVASRRGRVEPHLQARAAAIRATGTALLVEALDVTDPQAVGALVAKLTRAYGRLAGVIHTAMVLDDGLIAGLEPARTRAVLAPKVDGATNLDRATRGTALDYFVAFSSATTMVGNPGQGAYVAANGYLQGLMRRRRAEGLPGLAVGWGAIADVGVLSRDVDVAAKLERISGIVAMQSREALAHLDALLARGPACPSTVYCATFRPGAALQSLKLLRTPAFAQLFASAEAGDLEADIDLATQIAGKTEGEARTIVARLVASEVARIFRLSAEEIEVGRPLDELGMDSMMSLDLRMGLEKRFGVELPIVALSAGVSVNDLASRMIAGLRSDTGGKSAGDVEQQLIQQHGAGDVDVDDLVAFTDALKVRKTEASLL
ncbi:MAG TPA: SDR family NAD(P)-dependent oxidoreductase [Aliidongia sp.]|uniref:SDR family NAD(P)-dependent oxidoreductase n=1 Tax=Aliidongia sp. TaxID=1914230 RepID=UPI002DDDA0CA|nr:SDR family NAD(P)-dependent oxidoreductase [Aliidongia sp.]HEV2678422.1 SDR family NAD(P)-dependent oxidoreductase [Aliidongia sp.]